MRKLFLLIPALALSLLANAKVINITPTSPESSNNLRIAINNAVSGDIIEMAAGTYDESDDWLAFTDKEVTVRAAEGADVILKPRVSVRVKAPTAAAKAEFIGVKFDCSEMGSYSELFVPADDQVNQKLILKACEIYNWTKNSAIIRSTSARRFDVIEIDDCYFHNCLKSCVFLENAHLVSLSITNSTFADITTETSSFYAAPIHVKSTEGEVTINHCTFYNVETMSSSYGVVTIDNIDNVTISNSIFAHPTTVNQYAVSCVDGSTIDYCLAYKMNGYNDATSTHDRTGNPYFMNTNPVNYDFTIWTTSPAHGTADDGYDLGDYLRWDTDPATHVATVNITAEATNSLKSAVDAALPGDVIILAAGTYEESESISLDKEITIKAADGASPIVKPVGNFAISNGVDITIQNIKFDGSDQSGVSNFIYAADALSNSLIVEGCEFYSFGNAVISATDSKLISACTINNCHFYNNTNSCIGLKNSAAANLTVSNSTFKNNDASGVGDGNGIGIVESKTSTGTVLVDHCTFYNCKVLNTDYGITKVASPSATVSNCIFSMPESTSNLRTVYIPSGLAAGTTVTNCIMHYFTHDSNIGVPARSGSIITNCSTSNPLFTDAANGDFTFPGDYANDNVSPARNAGTDGSDLGDPRWYTPAIYPTTDFSGAGYVFTAAKAKLTAGTTIIEKNESAPTHPYIRYTHSTPTGNAEWVIQATKACYVQATVNMVDNTWTIDPSDADMFKNHKHIFVVEVRKANNTLVGSVKECEYDEDGSTDGIETDVAANPNVILPGQIYIPEAGVYTIILRNPRNGSRCGVGSVTLAYAGGDIVPVAANANTTLNVADALFTEGFTRADGQVSPGAWKPADPNPLGYVKWNIATSETKFYNLTLNFSSDNAHSMAVNIYEDEEASPVATVSESYTSTTGTLTLTDRINLVGGKNYIVKVTNPTGGSHAKVTNIVFAPVVATSTALPNTLDFSNAVLSEKAFIQDEMLYFNTIGDTDPRGQWAQWEVTTDHNGLFLFTMGVTSENEQSYKITILDNSKNELDYFEANPGSGDQTIKHYFALNTGSYFVEVENTRSYSKGHLTSLVVTEPAGVVTIDESATDNTSWSGKVDDETNYDVQIIRTIKAGMYNTFCLPFAVSSNKAKEIFGSDVEIYTLDAAEVTDDVLYVTLKKASDIYQGTPVFIKPSRDIVNPVFNDVKFTVSAPGSTTKDNANFVGTFVQTTLEPDQNILFLGADNTLYYPAVSIPIKGMRGWFVVHDISGPAHSIRRMQIVERLDGTTGINTVNENANPATKTIINGKLIIIRDGVMYDIMGRRMAE